MSVRFLFLTTLLGLFSLAGFAQTSYRVQAGQSLPAALTAAAAGDIIYVDGGIYGDISITKKVILIGTGYFGAGGSAAPAEASVGIVQFKPGSEGSVIMGFVATNIYIGASNVTVMRNHVLNHVNIGYSGTPSVYNSVSNDVVKQNYIDGTMYIETNTDGNSTVFNFSVKNNIIRLGFRLDGSFGGNRGYNVFSGEFVYNTTGYGYDPNELYSGIGGAGNGYCKLHPAVRFKNNIFTGTGGQCPINDASLIPPVFANNVTVGFTVAGNTTLTDAQARSTLYMGWPTPTGMAIAQDVRSQLKAGAVALTAGEGGTQAGAFGGDDPYVLGGVPFIPAITQLTVPSTVTQGGTLNVTVKAQTNN